jgi:hypothetical protein
VLNQDDEIFVRLLGKNNPQVKALVAASALNPDMAPGIHEMFRGLVRQGGWNPDDPPSFYLPYDLTPGVYIIGTAKSGEVRGAEVGLAEADLVHVGVFGLPGNGKSTLIKLLLLSFMLAAPEPGMPKKTFLLWDTHDEYRDLLNLFSAEELVWLQPAALAINPLAVPTGRDGRPVMAPEQWINNLREWLRIQWLNEPSLNLFSEILLQEYFQRGVMDGNTENYPCISDLIEIFERLSPPRGSDRARARDKLLDRLQSLRMQLPGLDVQGSRDFLKLIDHSIILDTSNVKDVARPVLFSLLVMLWKELLR